MIALESDYDQAFTEVISELSGPPEILLRMRSGRAEFLQLLGDSRKAGQWVAQTLEGLDWDWPRWHTNAASMFEDDNTLPALRAEASAIAQADALNMMTVPQLKALLLRHGSPLPTGKATKADVLAAVQSLPPSVLNGVAQELVQQWLGKKVVACRQKMGTRMAGRISHIAMERMRLCQRSDPACLALRPRWQFICGDPQSAPKSCKKFNGKVLPAQQALGTFPRLPCERIDCMCRIATQA